MPASILTASTPSRLRQARSEFLSRAEVTPGLLREPVVRSWRRSLGAGLSPLDPRVETPRLSAAELTQAQDCQRALLAQARPVMEYLNGLTRGADGMVILADNRGLLLHALGDAAFLGRAERVNLQPGACWHEDYRGTNAIGTALAEASPVVIHGAEHYLERNAFLTCTAAPLFDPRGLLLGVLDISSEARAYHPHTAGLVGTAAQLIENKLFTACGRTGLLLRLHARPEGIGGVGEGLLALTEEGQVVGGTRAGLELLGLTFADLGLARLGPRLAQPWPALLDHSRRRPGETLRIGLIRGGVLYARLESERPVLQPVAPPPAPRDALAALSTGDARLAASIDKARRVADRAIALLLQGETGAGKEVFARAVHASSDRRDGPFVAINCAALPENLIEAELFGYAPGAFTGAHREGAPGRIREAHGGTLFLDEIGDMPPQLQSRLLRVLEERRVTPLGRGRPVEVDFRLVCATHRALRQEVEAGRFRSDLYYRINGLTLALPPLRDRQDLPVLVERILADLQPRDTPRLDADLAAAFAAYAWPGNLRQLTNVLRTACALLEAGESEIGRRHLADDFLRELESGPDRPAGPAEDLRGLADQAIARAIAAAGGNMSEAARRLGISRNTLYRRLKRAGGP